MSRWVDGRVVGNRHWTEQLYSLRIEAQVEPFSAGQFSRLALDIDGERVGRPYSYVNAPHEPVLEFYSIIVPGGPLSPRLARLAPGDGVFVAPRASGLLTLREVGEAQDVWLLATGTGLGPFLSILKSDEVWQRFEQVVLAHAVRRAAELTYRDLIERLLERHAGRLRYLPFVSREPAAGALPGRIPAGLQSGVFEQRAGLALDPDRSQVLLCGNPAMVRDTTAVLEGRGFRLNKRRDPGNVTIENYWK